MKISNQNLMNPALQTEKSKGKEKAGSATKGGLGHASNIAVGSGAQVEISEGAQLRNFAKTAALQAEVTPKERVAELKRKIQTGEYKVDTEGLAEKILEDHLTADFGKNNV